MLKVFWSLLVGLMLSASFSGCGGGDTVEEPPPAEVPSEEMDEMDSMGDVPTDG